MRKRSVEAFGRPRLLLLIRHGKAAPKGIGLSDFERVLTSDGIAECRRMAKMLVSQVHFIDQMLSSPADRALETAHIFSRALGFPTERIAPVPCLYSSDKTKAVIKRIKQTEQRTRVLALVGHNPMLDELASFFVPEFSESIDKGGIVAISFTRLPWAKIRKGSGQLAIFLAPSRRGPQSIATFRRYAGQPFHADFNKVEIPL